MFYFRFEEQTEGEKILFVCLFCFVFEAILGFYKKKKKPFDLVEDTNEATWFTIYVKKILIPWLSLVCGFEESNSLSGSP